MTMLSPADAVWYRGETDRNPMVVSGVFWLDRRIDVERLRLLLADRVVARFPAFRQRVVAPSNPLRLPQWQDDENFDLDRHLEVVDLPSPGDLATVHDVCGQQRSRLLDRDRPLWQVHVLHGYRGDRSVVHARIHHCIGDGWVLVRLLLTLTDRDPAGQGATVGVSDRPPRRLSDVALTAASRFASLATDLGRHPRRLAGQIGTVAGHAAWGAHYLLAPPRPARTTLMGRPGGVKRMAWTDAGLPLQEVKAVGRRFDATVNDVLMAALAGTLRRYLEEHASLADEALLMAPIALRRTGDELPRRLGNRIGLLPVLLPVGMDRPDARLLATRDRMRQLKASPGPLVSWGLLGATALTGSGLERVIHRYHQARSTGVVTNVPGPSEPIYLAGARVEGLIGWGGVTANINLTWSYCSLDGNVFAGLVTDEAVTPQPGRLLDHLEAEWEQLRTLPSR